jgi:hypothetical protein
VFENRVLKKMFGPKKDVVTGEWRKFRRAELHNFNSSPNIIRHFKSRRIRSAGHVARMGEDRREECTRFCWESEEKRLHRRPRRRLENGIRMDLRKIGCGGVEWI